MMNRNLTRSHHDFFRERAGNARVPHSDRYCVVSGCLQASGGDLEAGLVRTENRWVATFFIFNLKDRKGHCVIPFKLDSNTVEYGPFEFQVLRCSWSWSCNRWRKKSMSKSIQNRLAIAAPSSWNFHPLEVVSRYRDQQLTAICLIWDQTFANFDV